jgi:hypothetical protein
VNWKEITPLLPTIYDVFNLLDKATDRDEDEESDDTWQPAESQDHLSLTPHSEPSRPNRQPLPSNNPTVSTHRRDGNIIAMLNRSNDHHLGWNTKVFPLWT